MIRPALPTLSLSRAVWNGISATKLLSSSYPSFRNLSSRRIIKPATIYAPSHVATLGIASNALLERTTYNQQQISRRHFSAGPSRRGIFGLLASAGTFALAKGKSLLVILKLTKITPLISMIITSGAYAFIYGWPYALGMVGLIFCHETGHMLVMRHYGIPHSPAVFLPFVGAFVGMQEPPKNAYQDAMIAFGGPVSGTAAAAATSMAAFATDSQMLFALADFGYMINLFNLIPLGSMDGGRIGGAISPYFGLVGLAGGGALLYAGAVSNPIFYLLMLSGAFSTGSRLFFTDDNEAHNRDYYRIGAQRQVLILAGYLGLVALLLAGMAQNNQRRKPPRQIEFEQRHPEQAAARPWESSDDEFFPSSFDGPGDDDRGSSF